MSLKKMLLGISAVAAVALPGVASAQSYGYGHGYNSGRYGYSDRGYSRHDRYRWAQQRRWEREQRRRWEWQQRHRHHRGYDRDWRYR